MTLSQALTLRDSSVKILQTKHLFMDVVYQFALEANSHWTLKRVLQNSTLDEAHELKVVEF